MLPLPDRYSSRIIRESGASVMRFASGASLQLDAGAQLGGGFSLSGSPTFTGGALFQSAACIQASQLKLGTDIAASGTLGIFEIMDMGNGVKFFLARTQNAPSAAGSPGSLMIRLPSAGTPSSAVDFYIKRGDNNPASGNWVAFQTTASAG